MSLQKAKRLQRIAEKVVTLAKRDSNAAMAKISHHIPYRRKVIIDKLVNEIAPRFANRQGGYTRVLKTGFRRGDNAEMAIIEYLENDVTAPKERQTERPAVDVEAEAETVSPVETVAEEQETATEISESEMQAETNGEIPTETDDETDTAADEATEEKTTDDVKDNQ